MEELDIRVTNQFRDARFNAYTAAAFASALGGLACGTVLIETNPTLSGAVEFGALTGLGLKLASAFIAAAQPFKRSETSVCKNFLRLDKDVIPAIALAAVSSCALIPLLPEKKQEVPVNKFSSDLYCTFNGRGSSTEIIFNNNLYKITCP